MKSILDPSFKYTNAAQTDISKTFARIRREQRREQVEKQAQPATVLLLPLKVKA